MKKIIQIVSLFTLLFSVTSFSFSEGKPKKNPYMDETPEGRKLILPESVDEFLDLEFPKFRIPEEKEFSPDMLSYFNSRLIGIHPAITWGDFNGDKKTDYAILVITSEGKLGPLMELVILNGDSGKEKFSLSRLGEIYNFKEDYLSFQDEKLIKGRYKKGAWFINWDKKNNQYKVTKS